MTTDIPSVVSSHEGRRSRPGPATAWAAVAALALIVGAILLVVLRPTGSQAPEDAAVAAVEDDAAAGTAAVLAARPWGDGHLVLVGYDDLEGSRHLALAFTIDRGRGWLVAALSEEQADRADVVVGSLLVAGSRGGRGQPSWSAAYGELSEDRIARVEVAWASGDPTSADRRGDAYLVVREGEAEAELARFIAADGGEIARVPI